MQAHQDRVTEWREVLLQVARHQSTNIILRLGGAAFSMRNNV
ncbi:hypothetical protein [Paenibacillus sp. ACRSA]|nr:hypothetical protein [Paenibacillus sp. ACRSA]